MNAFLKVVIYISTIIGGTAAALAAPTVYIPLGSGNQVVAVDAATDRIINSYLGVDNPHGLVATPDGEYIVAGSMLENPPAPEHVVLSADEKILYTLNPRAGTVSAVSAATGKISQTYKIGANLHGLELGDDGRTLFISSVTENKLVTLDTSTGAQRVLALSPAPIT